MDVALTDGSALTSHVVIPDPGAMLGLKAWARTVRREDRDAEDLWRCLDIALAADVSAEDLHVDPTLAEMIPILRREFGPAEAALEVITRGMSEPERTRRRTRVRALLAEIAGTST
jgi:hypothetical protein